MIQYLPTMVMEGRAHRYNGVVQVERKKIHECDHLHTNKPAAIACAQHWATANRGRLGLPIREVRSF